MFADDTTPKTVKNLKKFSIQTNSGLCFELVSRKQNHKERRKEVEFFFWFWELEEAEPPEKCVDYGNSCFFGCERRKLAGILTTYQ